MNDYEKNIEQYKILHEQGSYGTSSEKLYDDILPLVKEVLPYSILDFGCGQSLLINKFKDCATYRYDPAIEEIKTLPNEKIDLVLCNDVMEHIPENYIDKVLDEIKNISNNVIFSIAIVKAVKVLPNGQNAHCTVKPINWWMNKLRKYFPNITFVSNIRNVKFICKTWV